MNNALWVHMEKNQRLFAAATEAGAKKSEAHMVNMSMKAFKQEAKYVQQDGMMWLRLVCCQLTYCSVICELEDAAKMNSFMAIYKIWIIRL